MINCSAVLGSNTKNKHFGTIIYQYIKTNLSKKRKEGSRCCRIPYSIKLWWDKTLADLELQENWQRKFWQLITLIIVHY